MSVDRYVIFVLLVIYEKLDWNTDLSTLATLCNYGKTGIATFFSTESV